MQIIEIARKDFESWLLASADLTMPLAPQCTLVLLRGDEEYPHLAVVLWRGRVLAELTVGEA